MLAARRVEWQSRLLGSRTFGTPKGLFMGAAPSRVSPWLTLRTQAPVFIRGTQALGL